MFSWLRVTAGVLTFGQYIKKPCLAYHRVSRVFCERGLARWTH